VEIRIKGAHIQNILTIRVALGNQWETRISDPVFCHLFYYTSDIPISPVFKYCRLLGFITDHEDEGGEFLSNGRESQATRYFSTEIITVVT
jgi:hypothetical protein